MNRGLVWAVAGLAAVVCGCGGGSGSDGGGGTGLVPDAPAIGAVLYADATTLRPLHAGAVYKYRGMLTPYTGATPTIYTTDTTQTATAGAAIAEASSNTDNAGGNSTTVTASAGIVAATSTFNFTGTGPDEVVSLTELRSPVRVNDQYILLERHYDNAGVDVDGDGKPDSLDVAIYARVIGSATLTFRNLPALDAVEVDTVVVARVRASSTGQAAVAQGIQKNWYAPGIGVVRRGTDVPSTSGSGRVLTDETIVSWDGVSEGLGALPPQAAVVPASGGALAGTELLGGNFLVGQFAFADHAVVATTQQDVFAGMLFSAMDLHGNVTSSNLYPAFRLSDSRDRFATYAGGIVHFATPNGSAIMPLTRFDANGVMQGSIGAVSLDLGGTRLVPRVDRFEVAGDGNTLWVMWSRSSVNLGVGFQTELLLRGFDAQGVPITPELVLEGTSSLGQYSLGGVTAKAGRALAWWLGSSDAITHEERYTVVTPLDTTVSVRQLVTGLPTVNVFPIGLLLDTGGAFVWSTPMSGSFTPLPSSAGVRLDALYAPQRSGSGSIDAELLGNTPLFDKFPVATGQRVVVSGTVIDALWAEASASEPLDVVATLKVGTAPLASVPGRVIRSAPGFSVGTAGAQLAFPDRVLLFGKGFRLSTTVVWLR